MRDDFRFREPPAAPEANERCFRGTPECNCQAAAQSAPPELHKANAGLKYDSGKAQLSLIPLTAQEAEARALMYGVSKYGRHNYKGGFEYSRLIDAALRHIAAFNEGEDLDPESLVNHLGHAKACLSFLIDQHARQVGEDDRFKEGVKGGKEK